MNVKLSQQIKFDERVDELVAPLISTDTKSMKKSPQYTEESVQLIRLLLSHYGVIRLPVLGDSMRPTIPKEATIEVESVGPEKIEPGDIIVYIADKNMIQHRVIAIDKSEGEHLFYIVGDNTISVNKRKVDRIIGRVRRIFIQMSKSDCSLYEWVYQHSRNFYIYRGRVVIWLDSLLKYRFRVQLRAEIITRRIMKYTFDRIAKYILKAFLTVWRKWPWQDHTGDSVESFFLQEEAATLHHEISMEDKLVIAPHISCLRGASYGIIFDGSTKEVQIINPIALSLSEACDGMRTCQEIITDMTSRFEDVEPTRLRDELQAFFRMMVSSNYLKKLN